VTINRAGVGADRRGAAGGRGRPQAIIEQAKVAGGRRVSGHWEKIRSGQTARLIVNEAREMRAAAIVLPLPPRRGTSLFGAPVETVLAERPCRVIVERPPLDDGAA
jgi:APA family basic amino acid/polyamine antiporter